MNVNDPIWVSGMDKQGNYIKQGRKAIFKGYMQNGTCLIQFADIPFRKGGLDSVSITCLVSNVSPRV